MPAAGLIYGPEYHYLDHLAPLCSLLDIPLIVTDQKMAALATTYYPNLTVQHLDSPNAPDQIVQSFDTILYTIPRVLFEEICYFAQAMQNKQLRTIWVPHGNSDKGRNVPFMEALAEETLLVTYGKRIEEFLKEKGAHGKTLRIGNYRHAYYKKHKNFYEKVLKEKVSLPRKKILLYAPTWQDSEESSSFADIWHILKVVPEEFFLIVKLHPNLYIQYPDEVEALMETAPENLHVLENFPPIYPVLAKTDLYIGDASSIGYDFLTFQKPMVFLTDSLLAKEGTLLERSNYSKLFEICKKEIEKKPKPSPLLKETFSSYKINPLKELL